jgi:hypothetical protein
MQGIHVQTNGLHWVNIHLNGLDSVFYKKNSAKYPFKRFKPIFNGVNRCLNGKIDHCVALGPAEQQGRAGTVCGLGQQPKA